MPIITGFKKTSGSDINKVQGIGYTYSVVHDSVVETENGGNVATGMMSHAEGRNTTASGNVSHAEGFLGKARGMYSHVEGENCEALQEAAHAEGLATTANGISAHAEGNGTVASKHDSHAEGVSTIASGVGAHAEGADSEAAGDYSHAEGLETYAVKARSHAEGYGTKTGQVDQHVQGRFNSVITNAAEVIGNGTSDDERSNARVTDWNGNMELSGNLSVNGDYICIGGAMLTSQMITAIISQLNLNDYIPSDIRLTSPKASDIEAAYGGTYTENHPMEYKIKLNGESQSFSYARIKFSYTKLRALLQGAYLGQQKCGFSTFLNQHIEIDSNPRNRHYVTGVPDDTGNLCLTGWPYEGDFYMWVRVPAYTDTNLRINIIISKTESLTVGQEVFRMKNCDYTIKTGETKCNSFSMGTFYKATVADVSAYTNSIKVAFEMAETCLVRSPYSVGTGTNTKFELIRAIDHAKITLNRDVFTNANVDSDKIAYFVIRGAHNVLMKDINGGSLTGNNDINNWNFTTEELSKILEIPCSLWSVYKYTNIA